MDYSQSALFKHAAALLCEITSRQSIKSFWSDLETTVLKGRIPTPGYSQIWQWIATTLGIDDLPTKPCVQYVSRMQWETSATTLGLSDDNTYNSNKRERESSPWQHGKLANQWGQDHVFKIQYHFTTSGLSEGKFKIPKKELNHLRAWEPGKLCV